MLYVQNVISRTRDWKMIKFSGWLNPAKFMSLSIDSCRNETKIGLDRQLDTANMDFIPVGYLESL